MGCGQALRQKIRSLLPRFLLPLPRLLPVVSSTSAEDKGGIEGDVPEDAPAAVQAGAFLPCSHLLDDWIDSSNRAKLWSLGSKDGDTSVAKELFGSLDIDRCILFCAQLSIIIMASASPF